MPEFLDLSFYIEQFSYLGVFLAAVLGGYVLPIPEELVLIAFGYLSAVGVVKFLPLTIVAFIGATTHDHLLYYLSRRGSKYTTWLLEKMNKQPFLKEHVLHQDKIWVTLVLFRFIPYVRLAGPILAGSSHVPLSKFSTINIATLIVYVPVFVGLGYLFHSVLDVFLAELELIKHAIAFSLMLILLPVLACLFMRHWKML